MKASAMSAVPESFWMLRIMARAAKLGVLAKGSKRGVKRRTEEDDELAEDEEEDGDVGTALGDGHEEGLKVLCLRVGLKKQERLEREGAHDEDGVRSDESNLWMGNISRCKNSTSNTSSPATKRWRRGSSSACTFRRAILRYLNAKFYRLREK